MSDIDYADDIIRPMMNDMAVIMDRACGMCETASHLYGVPANMVMVLISMMVGAKQMMNPDVDKGTLFLSTMDEIIEAWPHYDAASESVRLNTILN